MTDRMRSKDPFPLKSSMLGRAQLACQAMLDPNYLRMW